ncbi:twin-arginine translocation pathway signal protein [Sphingomonadaceae bacterium jetA1]|jgi:DNA-binding beta-propeller fold protein YncE|uniref:YncE family protein n=1 Tax=Facivitalis istanbulensis TaxID=3075838 RepID=UPI003491CC2E
MSPIDRRQGLWGLTALGLAAAIVPLALRRARAGTPAAPRGTLAVVEKGEGRVAFYRLPDGARLGTVPLGIQPHEMVADDAGRLAYVGGYGVKGWQVAGEGGHQLWVVDLAARRLARTIDLAPHRRWHGVRMDAKGRLYALSESDSQLARFDRPDSAGSPDRMIPVGGARSHYFVVNRDGDRAYIADTMSGMVIMVNPEDASIAPVKQHIGQAPEGLALSPDERTLYVVDRPAGILHALDAVTLQSRARVTLRGEAVRVIVQDDGRLIVSNPADQSLTRHAPATLAEEARLPLPAAAPGLTLPAGGRTLYAALADNRIAIIDLASWRLTHSFATGDAPDTAVLL